MPIPMMLHHAEVRIPSYTEPNKKDPTKPAYIKVNVLPEGADSFLNLNCLQPVVAGIYNMRLEYKKIVKGINTYHFFDLVEAVPVVQK